MSDTQEVTEVPKVIGGPRFETTPDVYDLAETPDTIRRIKLPPVKATRCVEQPCWWPIYDQKTKRCKNHHDLYIYKMERKKANR